MLITPKYSKTSIRTEATHLISMNLQNFAKYNINKNE